MQNDINDTKFLLEDESDCNNNLSLLNRKFNNTQLLLEEKIGRASCRERV